MSSAVFNRIYKLLAVLAVSTVIAQVMYLFFNTVTFALWPVILIFCAGGYAMQALYGTVTGRRHDSRRGYGDETGYEASETSFKPLYAAGPLIVSVVISILLYKPFDAIFYVASKNIPGLIYSENSLYPVLMVIAAFIGLASGVILWFYPAHRIISLRRMMTFLPIMWVVYMIAAFSGLKTNPMAVFLGVFAVCSFIVLNQTHIQRGVTDTLTVITGKGRVYNIKLIVFTLFIMLVIVLVMAAIVVGIARILQFLLALVILSSSSPSDPIDRLDYDVDSVYSQYGSLLGAGEPLGERLLFVLFIVLFIGAVIIMITRGTDMTKRMLSRVKEWFSELFMFFMDVLHYNRPGRRGNELEFANFRDEEIRLGNAEINEYKKGASRRANSYRDFIAQLNDIRSANERIRFAYVTLMASYRARGIGNKPSETPREARRRIESRTSDRVLGEVTDAIETVDYRETELPEDEGRHAILSMCSIIEKHYDA